jgi:Fibronectin type III domain
MSSFASARTVGQTGQWSRTARAVANTALIGLVAGGVTMTTVQVAQAATPPQFPNNIVIFPQRDFVVLEGYEARAGQTATVVVTRDGVETSRAVGTVGPGDPSLEINHPGGECWQGVTPNIKPGDVVRVSFSAGGSDSARTLTPRVTGFTHTPGTRVVEVNGRYGPNTNTAQMEQRIINPDLDETAVGRRDVRAPSRPGPYTSSLTFNNTAGTFTSRYVFDDPAVADIAAQGQMRVLSWMAENADGERMGLTIDEFGEAGGPGFGGCPTGPESKSPNAPTNVTATAGNRSLTATWSPATTMPDATPVTGYRVTAVSISGVRTSVDAPVCTTSCTATVPNLVNGQAYDVEVRAINAAGASAPGRAPGSVSPVGGAVRAPTGVTAVAGATDDTVTTASVSWTAPAQPAGVTVEGWRITAFNADTGSRIKRVFADEPDAATTADRSRVVNFATGSSVLFRVQAISADEAGTLSALSPASNTVLAR